MVGELTRNITRGELIAIRERRYDCASDFEAGYIPFDRARAPHRGRNQGGDRRK